MASVMMRAGQLLVVCAGPAGAGREAEVVEVLGANAGPPFLVRWLDTGRTSVVFPDGDVWPVPRTRVRIPEQRGNRSG